MVIQRDIEPGRASASDTDNRVAPPTPKIEARRYEQEPSRPGALDDGQEQPSAQIGQGPERYRSTQPDHGTQPLPAETTDLERRVLAHERILRTLVAHMTETEPRFLARLSETFIVPMQMARREHDYKDTDSYAEEFIRAIVHVMETSARKTSPAVTTLPLTNPLATPELDGPRHSLSPTRLQIHERSGVWEVTVDGRFYGHYLKKEHALAAIIAMA